MARYQQPRLFQSTCQNCLGANGKLLCAGPSPAPMRRNDEQTIQALISCPIICPWCYIGKAHLTWHWKANPTPVAIEWQPLSAETPTCRRGMDGRAYLEGKFRRQDGAVRAYAPVVGKCRESRAEDQFWKRLQRHAKYADAHRLIPIGRG